VWDALAARYSLYTLDLLGFGCSEKPRRASYAIAEQADLCQALLAQHGVGRVHVLAHDYGDTVAQELLARAQEGRLVLDSVMFLNGGLFPETHRARRIQKLLAKPLLGPLLARRMRYEHLVAAMHTLWGRTPPREQDLRDMWWQIDHDGGRIALARLILHGAAPPSSRALGRRLVTGFTARARPAVRSTRSRARTAGGTASSFGAGRDVLEDVGHYPQLEAPQRVLDAYAAFANCRRTVEA
jgi:pimeloyl-ACP methyl ester carboxylesterase